VYGSDAETAASLRLADGHMKTSEGDNLPIVDGKYVAGDVRAAENPALTALHALFVREHNFQVDRLHDRDPSLSGDQLYDQARAIVAAEIAHINYAEFLPHLLGPSAPGAYDGYDPSIDPRITTEFAGAAFRFGHSTVSGETEKLGEQGEILEEPRPLKDVFFEPPSEFSANSGADGFLRHLASDLSQAMDIRLVDDLRNFLIDPPVAQDLAVINIARGRDLGLGRLNETRSALGLEPYTDFDQITDDAGTVAALRKAFTTVDEIDLWTGGLSEALAPGAFVGPTFQKIIGMQFENLRDGDRLWFENQRFDAETLSMIKSTTLGDIIERNTATEHIQDDVFVFAERHEGGAEPERSEAPQLVIGSQGDETLAGGPVDDILVAEGGRHTMEGKSGDDDFVFTDRNAHAEIRDFEPGHDKMTIEFGQNLTFEDVQLSAEDGHALVQIDGMRIELAGVDPKQLDASSFVFSA
jgi:peroxidase